MSEDYRVSVRYFDIAPALQPYCNVLYAITVECPPGTIVRDCLHPEWASLRIAEGTPPCGCIGPGAMTLQRRLAATGPTSKGVRLGLFKSRIWGLGLLPAGWAKLVDGQARDFANRTVDGGTHPAFRRLAGLMTVVDQGAADDEATARLIETYLLDLTQPPLVAEETVLACQAALRDPETADVAQFAERAGLSQRSLERMCGRYFGFPPKLLLRRQRFLRSLAHFMLTRSPTWAGSLDGQYHDQAQFVREFRAFMGLTPGQYAAMPHPILDPVIQEGTAYYIPSLPYFRFEDHARRESSSRW